MDALVLAPLVAGSQGSSAVRVPAASAALGADVGAYGQEVAETTSESVTASTPARGLVTCRMPNAVAYSRSRFKREDAGRFVVCDVTSGFVRFATTATPM